MPETIPDMIQWVGEFVDALGVAVIVVGIAAAMVRSLFRLRDEGGELDYKNCRQSIGRSMLLGLEILVAADIIRTVTLEPTLNGVAVLAALVGVRTFLSWSLEVELYGRLPWKHHADKETAADGNASRGGH